MFRIFVAVFLVAYATLVAADAQYDSEQGVVIIRTPVFDENIGRLTISKGPSIQLLATALDKTASKMIGLCGKNPSIDLLFLNGKLNLQARIPKVTSVEKWGNPEENGDILKAGWVRTFVFTGEDASDLLDLLLEYRSVGLVVGGKDCPETNKIVAGNILVNFETRGLDRAMKRLKP